MATTRRIRADELEELLALYQQLNPEDPELDRTERIEGLWEEMLADESLEIVVAEEDGRIVSSCVCSITSNLTRNARPFAVVENVVTHEAYRGNGFGSCTLQRAFDIAAERNCYKVMLLTGSDAEWKLEFYEDCGFDREAKTGFVRYLDTDE